MLYLFYFIIMSKEYICNTKKIITDLEKEYSIKPVPVQERPQKPLSIVPNPSPKEPVYILTPKDIEVMKGIAKSGALKYNREVGGFTSNPK